MSLTQKKNSKDDCIFIQINKNNINGSDCKKIKKNYANTSHCMLSNNLISTNYAVKIGLIDFVVDSNGDGSWIIPRELFGVQRDMHFANFSPFRHIWWT